MTVIAVIPARLSATRLPRKPLRLLGGVPLIVRVWERVRDLGLADRIVVATDSALVAGVAGEAGAEVALTSADHPSGTDRVAEVAGTLLPEDVGVIVNIQGDEPFVSEQAVRGAIEMVSRNGFPVGTVATRATTDIRDRPDVVKVVTADDGRALYFSRAGIPYVRDSADASPATDALLLQHVGVYAYTPAALAHWVSLPVHPLEHIERLEQLRPLAAGIPIGVAVIRERTQRGIDTEEDLEAANAYWAEFTAGRS